MKSKFIVLTDLTEHSSNLIRYAHDWSRRLDNNELILLHKTDFFVSGRIDEEKRDSLIHQAISESTDTLRDHFYSLVPNYPDHVRFKTTMDSLPEALKELEDAKSEQLVFLGLKGTNLFKKILFGTHALDVIHDTTHTIVAIPIDVDTFNPERIIVAVEKENLPNIKALDRLIPLLHPAQPELNFYLISNSPSEEAEAQFIANHIKENLQHNQTVHFRILFGNTFSEELSKIKERRLKEVLVVQRDKKLSTDGIFRQIELNDLVYEGQTPLIVLP